MEVGLPMLFLIGGLLLGFVLGWFISKTRQSDLSPEMQSQFISRDAHEQLQAHCDLLRDDLKEKEEQLRTLDQSLVESRVHQQHLEHKLHHQQEDFDKLQRQARSEFHLIANKLLEEKSSKFILQNQEQMQGILEPLRDKVKEFEQHIDKKFETEMRDMVSLKKEIEQLRDLNFQLSNDAQNLVAALRGDNKAQGNWGEFRLELLLQKAGLSEGIHYRKQMAFNDESGKRKLPDFIINLPEEKHLVIDSKVSLVAYERYCNETDKALKSNHLNQHCRSLRQHVKDLESKKYQQLYQINSPDYLLLFVPIEPAYSAVLQNDSQLFLDALDKNIVIVTTSTLLATMRTVSFIWKQEKQKNNVLEIARQSGKLYDKFVLFVEDLKTVGKRLDGAQDAYNAAMNKLTTSSKTGGTLIGRAERIKILGAKTSKQLPTDLLKEIDVEGESDEMNLE